MNGTLLVTGGAGFIGSNFIICMLRHHPAIRIVCLDKLTYAGNLRTLTPLSGHPRFRFVQGDICDRTAVYRLFAEELPDMAVNFAAESHVDRSIETPAVFLETNVSGTAVLLDACRKFGTGRFHQISTDEVYGDLPLDEEAPAFTEDSPLRPSSPYSASKASADLLVMSYHRTYGLPVTISRCSNNYGAHQFPEKLIPLMVLQAMQDKPLPVYGDGRNVRDWIHVQDHCRAVEMILQNGKAGEIYNVGGEQEMANIDLVRLICRTLHKPESLITHVPDRRGHDLRYAVNPAKIRQELGFAPEIPFAQGIRDTIRWYQENRSWWEPILDGSYLEQKQKQHP